MRSNNLRPKEEEEMSNLRLAMDAAFWDLTLSSPQTLEGIAKAVPGEPLPLDVERSSKALRPQQLHDLRDGFPLGLIPSLVPSFKKGLGSFSLQTYLPGPSSPNWWSGLVGQIRPKKLISSLKKEFMECEDLDLQTAMDVGRHFLDKSIYCLGFFSQVSVSELTSLMFNFEKHGDKEGLRAKAMVFHQLPEHEITLETAWPDLFLDRSGNYWDVPASISLDLSSSSASDSGLRYHFGLRKNSGHPKPLHSKSISSPPPPPLTLLSGICAKAAFSYEKTKEFWREKEYREDKVETPWLYSYDVRLGEPHAALSAIFGGHCGAWVGGGGNNKNDGRRKRSQISGDLFGSLLYTYQHGKFVEDYMDLSRIDARLDVTSATSFLKGAHHLVSNMLTRRGGPAVEQDFDPLSSPRLGLILQQQVAGPIVFRVDSKFSFNSPSGSHVVPRVEDVILGLTYSFCLLESGKVYAWYSPKREEAMLEFRFYEF